MTATDHPDGELVDLALGHAAPERRSDLVEHLLACPRCRQEHEHLLGAVEAVTVAVPPVQPPLGFDVRVLARLGADAGADEGPGTAVAPRGRPTGRLLGAVAALVLVALVVGAAGGWWVGRGGWADVADDRTAALATADGRGVGTATVTEVDGQAVLVVGLTAGAAGDTYTCRMRFADGSTLDTAAWSAAPGAAWLVPLPDGRGRLVDIALVAPGARTPWSTADLEA